jgi:GTPase
MLLGLGTYAECLVESGEVRPPMNVVFGNTAIDEADQVPIQILEAKVHRKRVDCVSEGDHATFKLGGVPKTPRGAPVLTPGVILEAVRGLTEDGS